MNGVPGKRYFISYKLNMFLYPFYLFIIFFFSPSNDGFFNMSVDLGLVLRVTGISTQTHFGWFSGPFPVQHYSHRVQIKWLQYFKPGWKLVERVDHPSRLKSDFNLSNQKWLVPNERAFGLTLSSGLF